MLRRTGSAALLRRAWKHHNCSTPRLLNEWNPSNGAGTISYSMFKTNHYHASLGKQFQASSQIGDSARGSSAGLSDAVLKTMVGEAIALKDRASLNMLVNEAIRSKNMTAIVLAVQGCQRAGDYSSAVGIVKQCGEWQVSLPPQLCKELAGACVFNAKWHESDPVLVYMIENRVKFSERLLFFALSGLLVDPKGVLPALNLLKLVVLHKRDDLAKFVSFSKINKFAMSLGGNQALRRNNVDPALADIMKHMVEEYDRSGWLSFSVAKVVTALASAAGMDASVAVFARDVLERMTARASKGSLGLLVAEETDALSFIRALSQGDGRVARKLSNKGADLQQMNTGFSKFLIDSMFKHAAVFGANQCGILKTFDFYVNYWVLAHRVRGQVGDNPGDRVSSVYENLLAFHRDPRRSLLELSCETPFDRKLVRELADVLSLHHKVVFGKTVTRLSITKDKPVLPVEAPSLQAIFDADAKKGNQHNVFDGRPRRWDAAEALLAKLDDASLQIVMHKLVNTMQLYPSVSWMLILANLLQERRVPLPRGTLRGMLRMAMRRVDMYGMLEVMHVALREKELVRTAGARGRPAGPLPALPSDWDTIAEDDGEMQHPQGGADVLHMSDWNDACSYALGRKPLDHLPLASFKDAFLEMLALMRRCDVDLDSHTMRVLMRFLAQHMMHSDHLRALVTRVFDDKAHWVLHDECAVLTKLLIEQEQLGSLFVPVPLSANAKFYLKVLPESADQVLRGLGRYCANHDTGAAMELKALKDLWAKLNSVDGRDNLARFLHRLLEVDPTLEKNSRDIVPALIYCAFLLSAYDGKHRAAFELLHKALRQ